MCRTRGIKLPDHAKAPIPGHLSMIIQPKKRIHPKLARVLRLIRENGMPPSPGNVTSDSCQPNAGYFSEIREYHCARLKKM